MKDQTMLDDFSCGVIPYRFHNGQTEFLLIQHKAGHWAFPKGHPDQGEADLATARRELEEETGIRSVTIDEDRVFEESYLFTKRSGKRVKKRVVYFLGLVDSNQKITLQEAEVSDYKWASAKKTREKMTFDEGRALLDEVLVYMGE
jgi:8-oxo-dGTP pyrophosphatase MutT (NUDIX family)